jgi:F-type H+-transporting ATPase subunit b
MEQTLQALGGILLRAIPTVILLLLLHFYLKAVLFGPVEKMLREREGLTDGARKAAQGSLSAAEAKAQEYESKIREARASVYKEQEDTRKRWLEDQAAQIGQARTQSEAQVRREKDTIAAEASAARQQLEQTAGSLADQIATSVLTRRA